VIRILHLADLHLGWSPAFMAPESAARRRSRRDDVLRKAVDFALDPSRGVGLVAIAGDLFDHFAPEPAVAGAVIGQLARLTRAGIAVVTVPGNHDEITYANSVYRAHASEWPGLLVTAPRPTYAGAVTVGGAAVHVYGAAYTGGVTDARQPMRAFPRAAADGLHLAVLHGTLTESANPGDRSLPLSPAALAAAGYDYVALGHVHQHREMALGRGAAAYAGAVEGKGFDDPGCAVWTVVEADGGPARVRTVAADARPMTTVACDASTFTSPQELARTVEAYADPALCLRVRVVGRPAVTFDAAEITARLAPRFLHLELEDATAPIAEDRLAAWAEERTVLGEFVRRMRTLQAGERDESEREILGRALQAGVAALRAARRP
jgi:DNA repair exonuclease SbcCD nuclease subunit